MVEDLRTEGGSLKIVKTAERKNIGFIRLPALMTTTMPGQKKTIGQSLEL
jgi:methanogenic corrinoid protein MtbC1